MKEKFVVFEAKFIAVLTSVNTNNYSSSIEDLEVLIEKHKTVLSKSQVLTILYKINHELKMSKLQEKLFIEVEQTVMEDFSFE